MKDILTINMLLGVGAKKKRRSNKIKRELLPHTKEYNELRSRSVEIEEKNDCVVKMFSLAARLPYDEALRIANSKGRKSRVGMYQSEWQPMLEENGVKLEKVDPQDFIQQYPTSHKKLQSVTTHHMDRFKDVWKDGHRYILICRRHVAYAEDGVVHDWTRGRALRVLEILRITEPA